MLVGSDKQGPVLRLTLNNPPANALSLEVMEALELALANRVLPQEALTQTVNQLAATIAAKSPLAVKLGKKAVREQTGQNLADAYACASHVMVENMLASDAEEGISAFFDKREPVWRGD